MLVKKVPLLESKIANLELINHNWSQIDSLRSVQITMYKKDLESKNKNLSELNKSLKQTKVIAGGSILVTAILAIICAIK